MRVLVTRPEEDAAGLAAALREAGHEPVMAPLLAVEFLSPAALDPELCGVQALLFTSANGVRALAALKTGAPRRDLPVLAVGDASARAARDAGFSAVESAEGDVAALAELVRARVDSAGGALFHATASKLAGDLGGRLTQWGYDYRRAVLYRSRPATSLPDEILLEFQQRTLGAASFFSPRTAKTFATLALAAGLAHDLLHVRALCLSKAVADALGTLVWRRLEVAPRATQESLLSLL